MDKESISTNRVQAFLTDNIEKFAGFVNQVIHDEEFLKCVRELLPFDGVAYASMNVVPEKQVVKKMGIIILFVEGSMHHKMIHTVMRVIDRIRELI